jgi:hypothetical protein
VLLLQAGVCATLRYSQVQAASSAFRPTDITNMQKLTDKFFRAQVVQLQLFAGCPEYYCIHRVLMQHLDSAMYRLQIMAESV